MIDTFKRFPAIRHVRFCWHMVRFQLWWRTQGGLWLAPNDNDLSYLKGIWEGRY